MWDERYSSEEYAYGTLPNLFLEQKSHLIPQTPAKILCLAEGEGRNAVFLAKLGHSVTAVDSSSVGLKKAQKLALAEGVQIECICADLAHFDMGIQKWDAIISIFCPLPSSIRQKLYQELILALKPNGLFLLEAYTPAQIAYNTGGGKQVDVMQNKQSLSLEIQGLEFIHFEELEREVIEGQYHTGLGAVVQAVAVKK